MNEWRSNLGALNRKSERIANWIMDDIESIWTGTNYQEARQRHGCDGGEGQIFMSLAEGRASENRNNREEVLMMKVFLNHASCVATSNSEKLSHRMHINLLAHSPDEAFKKFLMQIWKLTQSEKEYFHEMLLIFICSINYYIHSNRHIHDWHSSNGNQFFMHSSDDVQDGDKFGLMIRSCVSQLDWEVTSYQKTGLF